MKRKKEDVQGDLFGVSEQENLRQKIRELDQHIAAALKRKDFQKAKAFTAEQETLLQRMVDKADGAKAKP
jgi:ketosteroid isomerase-like protein